MKYHKIRNVPLTTCTAESKIAYNLAFIAHINYQGMYDKAKAQGLNRATINDFIADVIQQEMREYRREDGYKPGQYSEDAIFACLNAGLEKYLDKPFIAGDYEQIGKAFPSLYL